MEDEKYSQFVTRRRIIINIGNIRAVYERVRNQNSESEMENTTEDLSIELGANSFSSASFNGKQFIYFDFFHLLCINRACF